MTSIAAGQAIVTQYLVAFGNGPLADLTTLKNVRAEGVTAGEWTEITPFVQGGSWSRGRQHEIGNFEAGTADVDVDNIDGRFSPWNTSSPYNGSVKLMKYLQIRASLGNLLTADSAGFDNTIGAWVAASNCTVARQTAGVSPHLEITPTTTAAYSLRCEERIAVRGGQPITAMATIATNSSQTVVANVAIQWLDSTLAIIRTDTGANVTASQSAPVEARAAGLAPANAVMARVLITAPSNASTTILMEVDQAGLFESAAAISWSAGTKPRFTGHINAWPERWLTRRGRLAQIKAADAFRLFAAKNITSNQYRSTVIADGATAYYRLGESSAVNGAIATDEIAARNGTFQGVVAPLQAPALLTDLNTACEFGDSVAATGYGWVSLPPAVFPLTTSVASVELWWKSNSNFAANNNECDLCRLGYTGGFLLRVSPTVFELLIEDTTNIQNPIWNKAAGDGKWHHMVGTLNAGRTSSTLYVDGVAVATASSPAIDWNLNAIAGTPNIAQIMRPFISSWGINGAIDEFAIYYGVTLTAAQVLDHYNKGAGAFLGEASGTRIGHVLDVLSWPTNMRALGSGATFIQAQTTSLASTKALAHMQAVETTEDGALFMGVEGKVNFIDRTTIINTNWGTPSPVFGDNPGELPFELGPDLGLDDLDLYTESTVSRAGGVTQQYTDSASSAVYGTRTRPVSTLDSSDAAALYRAQWEVSRHSTPLARLNTLTIESIADPSMPAAILALDVMKLITVNRHDITGTAFAQTAVVEKMVETDTPTGYSVTFSVSPIQAIKYWILGTSALDTTTRLAL